jgi:hypothetical protein
MPAETPTIENPTTPADLAEEVKPAQNGNEVYLIGGGDLEMHRAAREIEKVGKKIGAEIIINHSLSQREASIDGAKAYREDIDSIKQSGKTPVAIELGGIDKIPGVVEIDHHNANTGRPASLLQVMERLGKKPGFVDKLVAANDTGYIPAMEKLLAEEYPELNGDETSEEYKRAKEYEQQIISLVRAEDRKHQGVTAEMEAEAEEAIKHAEHGPNGLTIVRVNNEHSSQITDRLFRTGEKQNLVVVCSSDKEEKEVWFFGDGSVCKQIIDHFKPLKEQGLGKTPKEYRTVANGANYGKEGESALCLVVATKPEEVTGFIEQLETQQTQQ